MNPLFTLYFNEILLGATFTGQVGAVKAQFPPYQVIVDNKIISSFNTDTVGILETSLSLLTGSHTIEIKKKDSVIIIPPVDHGDSIAIYPNPAHNALNIIMGTAESFEIRIVSADGKTVLRKNNLLKIDISQLSSGIYILQIRQGKRKYVRKFLKA